MTDPAPTGAAFVQLGYRLAALALAKLLGRSSIVRSVYVRRSVATGEAAFRRSDVDLTLVVRRPRSLDGDAAELVALAHAARRLRRWSRVLGECEVLDEVDLARWARSDPYRASLDRRSALFLHGERVAIPVAPLRAEHAVAAFVFWFDRYLPAVLRHRRARDLRKFAVEMWNAYATAIGAVDEPYRTRSAAERAYRESPEAGRRDPFTGDLEGSLAFYFELAARLHARRFPALERLHAPLVFDERLPPRDEVRRFVLLPERASALPAEAAHPAAFVCTPEVLHLYVHHVNAFASWTLQPRLGELGFRPPSAAAFVRSCRGYGATFRLRGPGFFEEDAAVPLRRLRSALHAVPHLARGAAPPPLAGRGAAEAGTPLTAYYEREFPRAYAAAEQMWAVLDDLPDRERG